MNIILSLFLKGLDTVKAYIPSKKAKIGKQLRKIIDSLEDIIDRAYLIIEELRGIYNAEDYTVRRVYTLFYEQIKLLEKLNKILDKSEIFSLFRIYDENTYYNLRLAFNQKMDIITMLIGYLYEDKIYLRLTPYFETIDQYAFDSVPDKELVLEKFFYGRRPIKEITLTKDDYVSCRNELAKIDINKAKESIKELENISKKLKKFVVDNFEISDLF